MYLLCLHKPFSRKALPWLLPVHTCRQIGLPSDVHACRGEIANKTETKCYERLGAESILGFFKLQKNSEASTVRPQHAREHNERTGQGFSNLTTYTTRDGSASCRRRRPVPNGV